MRTSFLRSFSGSCGDRVPGKVSTLYLSGMILMSKSFADCESGEKFNLLQKVGHVGFKSVTHLCDRSPHTNWAALSHKFSSLSALLPPFFTFKKQATCLVFVAQGSD